jgi:hypothetical protein
VISPIIDRDPPKGLKPSDQELLSVSQTAANHLVCLLLHTRNRSPFFCASVIGCGFDRARRQPASNASTMNGNDG